MNSTDLANGVSKFRDRPFASGDLSRGVDCVNLLIGLFEGMGFEIPHEFEGVTRENYAQLYQTDQPKANEIWSRFLMSIGKEIDTNFYVRGDILLLKHKSSEELSMAIALGNGHCLMVLEKQGCRAVPVDFIKKFIYSVRRLCR